MEEEVKKKYNNNNNNNNNNNLITSDYSTFFWHEVWSDNVIKHFSLICSTEKQSRYTDLCEDTKSLPNPKKY
jgi:hypothetical protein